MFKYQASIRQKITFGYYSILAIIIGLSVFTLIELRSIEKKIIFGEAISEFFDTTLEFRRFEKNYFLYNQNQDYYETIEFTKKAQEILEKNIEGFKTIASVEQISSLKDNLKIYKESMKKYADTSKIHSIQRTLLEGKIRKIGKEITMIAEDISKTERRHLQIMLYNSQSILILSIMSLSLLGIAIGQVLSKMVVRPLKQLENSMEIIADGKFESLQIRSKDREIVSLTNAFNKMLRELELRQRHLVQSEKLKSLGTLLSGVAHELNNPLSNISTSTEILKEEINENDIEHKKELLAQIEEQTDRARNIVRSLLEFSRDKKFKKERIPLKILLEETIRFVKGQVPTRVSINIDISDDIYVIADKQRIQQAFLNLIKNAIESITDDGTISIKAQKQRAIDKIKAETEIYNYLKYRGKCTLEEDTVDIEIKDTGAGIPNELLPKIFDPFFTTKDVGKGSGLGLFIVHEIIEEHDGCIAVDSKVGKGTKFLIRLPIKE
ncbi:two-component sensor histidine kinase [Dissulfurispira thermophila]|uniref:histidine kinase n=1 Tax=Dissulfurispira thermophila TaxID=2715679 RepID=A0A7G1GYZ6_9BACT|nr:HAMP domain-containing sensor histidine kinase [Dissulfurispira thermophila]BCB95695.1 two-component sensor histidine kinase [Dissulfurispira thermophila]